MGNMCSCCHNNKKKIRPQQNQPKIFKKLNYNKIQKYETFTYLEQSQYLKWLGNYGENNQKIGNWKATWNGVMLDNIGGWYSDDGKKKGFWKELNKMYWKNAQVYTSGEYCNNIKRGKWIYIYHQNKIGGGSYNKQGVKNGRWIDLSDQFQEDSQIAYNGEYMNGKKVGRWDILYRRSDQFEKIGGGSYSEGGEEIKFGKWIEQSEEFKQDSQVIYKGEYQNGKKVGRWDVLFRQQYENEFKQFAGGVYDEVGTEIKLGCWVEYSKEFKWDSQVTYTGEYQNSKKFGKWDTSYRKQQENEFTQIQTQISGGGYYDEKCEGIKQGQWIELSDEFFDTSYVISNGEYQCGKKVGTWVEIDIKKDEKVGEFKYDS